MKLTALLLFGAAVGVSQVLAAPIQPANPNIQPRARAVLEYLAGLESRSDQRLLTGQFADFGVPTNLTLLDRVHDVTGRWPAIVGVDYADFPRGDLTFAAPNRAAIEYWRRGGIPHVSAHLYNPANPNRAGLRDGGLRDKGVDLDALLTEGTAAHAAWMHELDQLAGGLQELKDAGVVVLWRPFHEMNGGWFWWGGHEPEKFVRLWRHMFAYFTREKNLDNLLWVYGPNHGDNAVAYYPGDDCVDLVGLDAYTDFIDPEHIKGYAEMAKLPKPFGFSEYGPHGASNPPGNYDYRRFIDGLRKNFPRAVFFMSWNDHWSLAENEHTKEALADPSCVNRDDLPLGLAGPGQVLKFTPQKPSGIYAPGEKIAWTIEPVIERKITGATYTLKKNGLTVFQSGEVDLSSGRATIATSLDEPGAVLLEIQLPPAGRGGRALAGALVAPEKIRLSSPRPADFDSWWTAKIEQLRAIPANPQLTPGDSGRAEVEYAVVTLDNINGTHVHGQLAKPKREGKFPALLVLQWAGVYPLQKSWVVDRAAEGWLVLNVEPHDIPVSGPAEAYRDKLPDYWTIGDGDREKSYFLRMYLGDYRAADYLAHRSDWDGRTLVVKGDSMGGQQALAVAGLHPQISAVMALVPSSCDVTGPLHGRAAGFPDWARRAQERGDPKILEAGRYFDPVNFASRIRARALVGMGFIDEVCPPTGVWSAVNEVKGTKETMPLIDSPHQDNPQGVQRPWQLRSAEWLAQLVKGETPAAR
jgi:cephalosporin-C deacetylase-like acetyl esterase